MLSNYTIELTKISGIKERFLEAGKSALPGAILGASVGGISEMTRPEESSTKDKIKNIGKSALVGGLSSGLFGFMNQNKKQVNVESPVYIMDNNNIHKEMRSNKANISLLSDNMLRALPTSIGINMINRAKNKGKEEND